jgi:hypothetical protein
MVLMTGGGRRKVAAKVGWDQRRRLEINEAFSVQMVAELRELGIDPARQCERRRGRARPRDRIQRRACG